MRPVVVRVIEDLLGDVSLLERDEEDGLLVTFSGDPAELVPAVRKFWGMVLLLAVRDRAASVHYHPWRGASALAYVVDNTRYEMVPPPAEHADAIVGVARSTFLAPPRGFFTRLLGGERVACGEVTLDVSGNPFTWDVVCWSSGPRRGIELFRITPLDLSQG